MLVQGWYVHLGLECGMGARGWRTQSSTSIGIDVGQSRTRLETTVSHSNAMCVLKPPLWPRIWTVGWGQEYMHGQVDQEGNVPKQHCTVVG